MRITADLTKGTRKIATSLPDAVRGPAGQTVTDLSLTGLADIGLWSPASPALYDLTTTV